MISKKELINFVNTRSWYQTIQFEDDIKSKGSDWCGEPLWENIKVLLPNTLEGMRVLDLGCNAGLFCIKAALLNAKEIIGIDYPGWRPNWNFIEQRDFVKKYFEQKYNKVFPITYISGKMEDILETQDLGSFDYVFIFASLYYTERPESVVKNLSIIAHNVIVRVRDESRIKMVTIYFNKYKFKEKQVIREKWWEKLSKQTDDFYLYFFVNERDTVLQNS